MGGRTDRGISCSLEDKRKIVTSFRLLFEKTGLNELPQTGKLKCLIDVIVLTFNMASLCVLKCNIYLIFFLLGLFSIIRGCIMCSYKCCLVVLRGWV